MKQKSGFRKRKSALNKLLRGNLWSYQEVPSTGTINADLYKPIIDLKILKEVADMYQADNVKVESFATIEHDDCILHRVSLTIQTDIIK